MVQLYVWIYATLIVSPTCPEETVLSSPTTVSENLQLSISIVGANVYFDVNNAEEDLRVWPQSLPLEEITPPARLHCHRGSNITGLRQLLQLS